MPSGATGATASTAPTSVGSQQQAQNGQGFTDVAAYLNANQSGANTLGNAVSGNLNNQYNNLNNNISQSNTAFNNAVSAGYTPENQQLISQAASDPTGFVYNTPSTTTTPSAATGQLATGAGTGSDTASSTGVIQPLLNSNDGQQIQSGGTQGTQTPGGLGSVTNAVAVNNNSVVPTPASAAATGILPNGTLNQANIDAYQQQLDDSYVGPTGWNDTTNTAGVVTPGYGTLQGQVAAGQQEAGLVNNNGGQQELVSQVEQNPTAGISGLDALILGGNAPAVQQIQSAAAPFAGLTPQLNNLNTANTAAVTNAQTAAGQTAADALAAFTGANGTNAQLTNAINQAVTNAQGAAATNNSTATSLLQQIAAGTAQTLTPAQLSSLGISQDQYNTLQSLAQVLNNPSGAGTGQQYSVNGQLINPNASAQTVNLSSFLTPEATGMINANTVATPQQYQEEQAINQLIGANNTTGIPINANNASYAGTAPTAASFNYNAALSQLQNMLTGDYATPPAPGTPGPGTSTTQSINNGAMNPAVVLGTSGLSTAVPIVTSVVNDVANLFCFHENSPIMMLMGGSKPINKIELGDKTLGGEVLAIKVAYAEDMYWYSGVLVTGLHAVLDDNGWMRVRDTEIAIPFPGRFKVYNLVTSSHRIWVGGIEFADEVETDAYEMLDLNESIEVLNGQSL